jgi:hypothetical protein
MGKLESRETKILETKNVLGKSQADMVGTGTLYPRGSDLGWAK